MYNKALLMSAGKDNDIASHYCMLLPYRPSVNDAFQSVYSMITHEWLVLGDEGVVTEARLCTILFDKDLNDDML